MTIFICGNKNCIDVFVSENWTDQTKSEFGKIVKESETPLHAIQAYLARSALFEIEHIDLKAIAFHITRKRGFCHCCGEKLIEREDQCLKCKKLNFDW